jgi:uncharacterized membrane protein YkoI
MKRLLVIFALFAAAASPLAAAAQDAGPQTATAGRQVPLSHVLATIGARQPGRHLNTTVGDEGGKQVYFVQWQLTDGRIVIFVVDVQSGQILRRQGG